MKPRLSPPLEEEEICPRCLKPLSLCICDEITPVENRIALLVLQHPQEQDKTLGTARVAVQSLTKAVFKIGLSWPSLAKALGRPADPQRWAILYLGSIQPTDFPAGREIAVFDRQGKPVADQDAELADIEGIVVLDGTWSQAKTLWWRNPWVLKAKRIALRPRQPSIYGRLRQGTAARRPVDDRSRRHSSSPASRSARTSRRRSRTSSR